MLGAGPSKQSVAPLLLFTTGHRAFHVGLGQASSRLGLEAVAIGYVLERNEPRPKPAAVVPNISRTSEREIRYDLADSAQKEQFERLLRD